MSYRIEEKILLNKDSHIMISNFLKKNSAQILYNDRKVESIYFDNRSFQMHKDSEEGIVPRKKIRIRSYSDSKKKNLEKKISSVEGRFKTSLEINDNSFDCFIKSGYFDKEYGFCFPVVEVSYIRSYLQVFSKRITIDKDIKFIDYRFKNQIQIDQNILEIKTDKNDSIDSLNYLFPFKRSRFSKYSEAIKKLKIKN